MRRPARHTDVPAHLLTTDADALVARDDVDLVVEVIGGIEPARTLLLAALNGGKSVVSANKALLAEDGATLHDAAAKAGVDLYYEAAVAGAIPLLRPLRESLAGDRITRVMGIVNGTTNFILSRMDATGAGFDEALAEATSLGYAEADPTADVDAFDAAAKAAILAGLAFHTRVTTVRRAPRGHRRGDRGRHREREGDRLHVKLLAICERVPGPDGERVSVRVHPAMIPRQPSARRRRRRVQRRLRRGRRRRLAHVLRTRRGWRSDGERGPRRPGRGGPQPRERWPGRRRERVRRPADPADGRGVDALSRRARRQRRAGRARAVPRRRSPNTA